MKPGKGAEDNFIDKRKYPDLTPPGLNNSGRVVKNMRICGSGVYEYHRSEIPGLTAEPIPGEHKNVEMFGVYRPAQILKDNANLFARLSITVEHPDDWVTLENGAEYTRGLTGDYVEWRDEEDGETYLYTTGTFFDEEAVSYYEQYRELSCGYRPLLKWESGEHNGKAYQLVMCGLLDANHIALVPKARGGEMIQVLDGKNELLEKIRSMKEMNPLNLIFGALGAKDSVSKIRCVFDRAKNAEGIGQAADFVKPYLDKVKACDSKTELEGFLSDLKKIDESDKEAFVKSRDYVRDLAVKLVKDSEEPPKPEKEKEKGSEDDDETGKNDKTVNAANDEEIDKKIEKAVDAAVTKAMDGLSATFGKMLDERFPKSEPDGDDDKDDKEKGAADGDPNMTLSDKGKGAKDKGFTSDSLMEILKGGKK